MALARDTIDVTPAPPPPTNRRMSMWAAATYGAPCGRRVRTYKVARETPFAAAAAAAASAAATAAVHPAALTRT